METIKWKSQAGKEIKITVDLILEKELNADGDKITVPCCDIVIIAEVEEMGTIGVGEPWRRKGLSEGYVATIGKLGLGEDHCKQIEQAIAEVKNHPMWIAKQARIAENEKAEEERYKHLKGSGFCFKCLSYCHGDCTA